jgi:hypothetical protein
VPLWTKSSKLCRLPRLVEIGCGSSGLFSGELAASRPKADWAGELVEVTPAGDDDYRRGTSLKTSTREAEKV